MNVIDKSSPNKNSLLFAYRYFNDILRFAKKCRFLIHLFIEHFNHGKKLKVDNKINRILYLQENQIDQSLKLYNNTRFILCLNYVTLCIIVIYKLYFSFRNIRTVYFIPISSYFHCIYKNSIFE